MHWILVLLKEVFRFEYLCGGHFEFFSWVLRGEKWNADRLSFELTMLLVHEVEVVRSEHPRVQVTFDGIPLLPFHGAHNSRRQINDVAKHRKFFSASRCAGNSRKALARGDTDVAVRFGDLF